MGRAVANDNRKVPSQRTSVSFPRELYHIVELIAAQKKVSIAWVVRDAVEQYVADQWPLLKEHRS